MRRRDRGVCADCGLDTDRLRRSLSGRGRARKLRERGFTPRKSLWELDHIVPLIDGGGHDVSNLQTLCAPCHRRKTAAEAGRRAARRTPGAKGTRAEQREVLERELDSLLERASDVNARAEEALAPGNAWRTGASRTTLPSTPESS